MNYKIASIFTEKTWVEATAKEVSIESDIGLIFDKIAQRLINIHKFAGISSNNIYWNLTPKPMRIITIPATNQKKYITILNPEILKQEGQKYSNIESCGSIPDSYIVERWPYVMIGGYNLVKEYMMLEYGNKNYNPGEEPVFAQYHPKAWIIQHEIDHLNGVTIKDKGILFDINNLLQ